MKGFKRVFVAGVILLADSSGMITEIDSNRPANKSSTVQDGDTVVSGPALSKQASKPNLNLNKKSVGLEIMTPVMVTPESSVEKRSSPRPFLMKKFNTWQADKETSVKQNSGKSRSGSFDYDSELKARPDLKARTSLKIDDLMQEVKEVIRDANNRRNVSIPKQLIVTGWLSVFLSFLVFYVMYAHFLDALAFEQNVLFVDVDAAKQFFYNPDTFTTCLETAQATCTEQYVYASVFGMIGSYLFIIGGLRILENHNVCGCHHDKDYALGNLSYKPRSLNSRVLPKRFKRPNQTPVSDYAPGGKKFWMTCVATVCISLILQILRCFIVTGSYATTSAEHTLAQIFVITVHVNLSFYMYYTQSNFGFTIVQFCADIAYFIIRLASSSQLSMHSADFIDFLTMVVPLMICVRDIHNMTKFICLPPTKTKKAPSNSIFDSINAHRGKVAVFLGLVATILGGIGFVEVFTRHDECSNNVAQLPDGFECMDWHFNLYLDPSCSCTYMHINVPQCDESKAGFHIDSFIGQEDPIANSSRTESQVTPSFDHIEDSQLLVINYAPGCTHANAHHSEFISGFKYLQMISLQGTDLEELPSDLSNYQNLIAVYLNAPNLKKIESGTMDSWPKLQVLHCSPCPSLVSEGLFTSVALPRLQSVKLEGVSTCSDDNQFGLKEQLTSYECTNRNGTSICGNMPQWILQHHVNQVQQTSNSKCNEPSCTVFLDMFNSFDNTYQGAPEPDALFNVFELRGYLQHIGFPGAEDISDESYECMFEMIRQQVPFEQTVYQGADHPSNGITLLEFLASQSANSNCGQCAPTQGKITSGAENFANQQKFLAAYPFQCKESNVPVVDVEGFRQACNPPRRTCDDHCGFLIADLQWSDIDDDFRHNEWEFLHVTNFYLPIREGVFQCFFALGGSDCVDNSNGFENLQVPFDQILPMWVYMMGWYPDKEPTSCRDCWDIATDVEGCWNNDMFYDAQGYPCDGWIAYDCLEWYIVSDGYYTKEDMAHVIFNCPLNCGICEQFGDPDYCWDTLQFRDSRGNSCETWIGRDCFDQAAAAALGYSADALTEVQENCMFSCGQCIPQTAPPTIAPTTTPQPTMVNALPKQCKGLDWSPRANFIEAFNTTTTTCTPACSKIMGHILPWDTDENGYFTNAEIVEFKKFYGQDVSDLFPVLCEDNPDFRDSCWDTCQGWVGYDCFNDEQNIDWWGYSAEAMQSIQENCPRACGICISNESVDQPEEEPTEQDCEDTVDFVDTFAYGCSGWQGYDCTDVEQNLIWGYSAEDTADIIENCRFTCGLCDGETEIVEEQGPEGLLACLDALVPGVIATDISSFTTIWKIPKENYFAINLWEYNHDPSLCSDCQKMCLSECEADSN